MKTIFAAGTGALVLVVLSFAAGASFSNRSRVASAEPHQLTYSCPMHPQYQSSRPGDCPSCGMRLEPVRNDEAWSESDDGESSRPPGAFRVSAGRRQAIGVRLGVVERVSGTRALRTTGRVAPDENATYAIVGGTSGSIRSVGNATTGTLVKKNERLASFYSPEVTPVLQSYFAGLTTVDHTVGKTLVDFNRERVIEGVQRFADTLRNMGVSDAQLAELARKRELVQDIHLISPVDGFVLQRNVSVGLRFDRGVELYRIADLSRVWVLADVYQHQLPFLRRGVAARVTTTHDNHGFRAQVSAADPIFDEGSLTLKVRLEMANPGLMLKPGMFVDVEFSIELPETLAVPADAIVDSGTRKIVFVESGNGYFEPRQVETGWRIGGEAEITKGLMPGERIVISGTFLIDSESRMKGVVRAAVLNAVEDPVCGMQVDRERARVAGRSFDHDGTPYFFCADSCKHQFQKAPSRYVRASGQPHGAPKPSQMQHDQQQAVVAEATDPICSMKVRSEDAIKAGRVSQRDGKEHYFCSDDCKKTFESRP